MQLCEEINWLKKEKVCNSKQYNSKQTKCKNICAHYISCQQRKQYTIKRKTKADQTKTNKHLYHTETGTKTTFKATGQSQAGAKK